MRISDSVYDSVNDSVCSIACDAIRMLVINYTNEERLDRLVDKKIRIGVYNVVWDAIWHEVLYKVSGQAKNLRVLRGVL